MANQSYLDIISRNLQKSGKTKKRKGSPNLTVVVIQPPMENLQGGSGRGINTGAGPDGVVQPDRVAMVDMTNGVPKFLHEGEFAQPDGNNGVNVTPAGPTQQFMSNTIIPNTEADQFALDRQQKNWEAGGYEGGGNYKYGYQQGGNYNYGSAIQEPGTRVPQAPTPIPNPVKQVGGVTPYTPEPEPGPLWDPSGHWKKKQQNDPLPTPLPTPTPTPVDVPDVPITPRPIGDVSPVGPALDPRPKPTPTPVGPDLDPGRIPGGVTPVGPALDPRPKIIGDVTPYDPNKPVTPTPTPEPEQDQEWQDIFLEQYNALLASQMDENMARMLAAQKANAQRMATSPYMTEGAKLGFAAEQERTAGLTTSAMAGELAGKSIDAQIKAQQMGMQQEQIDFAKQKYGDLEGQRIAADINMGMTYEQIKAKYPNVTLEDYESMKAASVIGNQDYQKNIDQFNVLMQAGDYTNAEDLFKKIWPGSTVDFQKLIDEGKMGDFNTGMGQMSKYIASGLTWDEALAAMKKDGTLSKLGLSESDAKDMYDNLQMKASPIWQITNAISDDLLKDMFPNMEVDEARALITKMAMFGGMTMNEDGTFSLDEELMKQIFGPGGTGNDPTPDDYTYDDYKKDAEKAGGTPLSESDWEKAGSKKWEGVQDLVGRFDTWVADLPEKYDSVDLTAEIWDDLGSPSVDEYADWYENKGGKNYLTLAGQYDRIMQIQPDLRDIARAAGEYAYLKDLPQKEMQAEQAKLSMELFGGDMSPSDAKAMYQNLFKDFASQAVGINPNYKRKPWEWDVENFKDNPKFYTNESTGLIIEQTAYDHFIEKGYTEKQIQDMYYSWSALTYGDMPNVYGQTFVYYDDKWNVKG